MKTNFLCLFGIVYLFTIIGCKKDDDPEPISQTQAKLLSGNSNESKVWKVESGTRKSNNQTTPLVLNLCFLDNTYTFRNNAAQNYNVSEGATKCKSTDPDLTESGSWAFTQDGKTLIFHPKTVFPETASFGYLEAKIVELKSTSFKMSFENGYTGNDRVTITLSFKVL